MTPSRLLDVVRIQIYADQPIYCSGGESLKSVSSGAPDQRDIGRRPAFDGSIKHLRKQMVLTYLREGHVPFVIGERDV